MSFEPKVGDFVYCSRLGKGKFEILQIHDREYTLNIKDTPVNVFKIHCDPGSPSEIINMRKARSEVLKQRADKIGRVSHPKRK